MELENISPQDTNDYTDLVALLKNKKDKGSNSYHFRPYKIDGVYCYIVLYFKIRLITVECLHIRYKCQNNGKQDPYVIYNRKYTTLEKAIQYISNIRNKYKIIDGDLMDMENYNLCKLEEKLLPYQKDEVCSICYENTMDITSCNHGICLQCRDTCLLKDIKDCPICRSTNVLPFYQNRFDLINNRDCKYLKRLFYIGYSNGTVPDGDIDDSSSSDSDSDSDSSSESESEEEDDEREENNEPLGEMEDNVYRFEFEFEFQLVLEELKKHNYKKKPVRHCAFTYNLFHSDNYLFR
jgi:hypothetical protein